MVPFAWRRPKGNGASYLAARETERERVVTCDVALLVRNLPSVTDVAAVFIVFTRVYAGMNKRSKAT